MCAHMLVKTGSYIMQSRMSGTHFARYIFFRYEKQMFVKVILQNDNFYHIVIL